MYIFKIMYVLGRVPQHIVEALKHEALNRLTLFFFFFTILCVHVCQYMSTLEVKGQLLGVGLLLPCEA